MALTSARLQVIFIKAHHRYGPFFANTVVARLYQLGLQLEDLSAGLSKCSMVRCAMDTATVSLAAWQLLRKYAAPLRVHVLQVQSQAHARLSSACQMPTSYQPSMLHACSTPAAAAGCACHMLCLTCTKTGCLHQLTFMLQACKLDVAPLPDLVAVQ